jgi:hypothetical protein
METKLPASGDPMCMKISIADLRNDFQIGKAEFFDDCPTKAMARMKIYEEEKKREGKWIFWENTKPRLSDKCEQCETSSSNLTMILGKNICETCLETFQDEAYGVPE